MAVSSEQFQTNMDRLGFSDSGLNDMRRGIAVGVSGGPDSMALLWLLSRWAERGNIPIHAMTVDHALRPDSAAEAEMVGEWVRAWPSVSHTILRWDGDKPSASILEEARKARYAIMAQEMKTRALSHLFIAHHQDDQAETFLFRLAKGSGLDGLSGMRPVQPLQNGIVLVRPLLSFAKEDLIQTCDENNIPYVNDPTNKNERYLRPRLRAAKAILEEEGLSSKRLSTTARRLARARSALEAMAEDLFSKAIKEKSDEGFVFDSRALFGSHEELVLRVFLKAMDELRPDSDYAPRMERLEALMERILHEPGFKGATLGGCLFEINRKNETVRIGKEK